MNASDVSTVKPINGNLLGDQISEPGTTFKVENSGGMRIWRLIENLETLFLKSIDSRSLGHNAPKFREIKLLGQGQTWKQLLHGEESILRSSILLQANRKCVGMETRQKRLHGIINDLGGQITIGRSNSKTNQRIQETEDSITKLRAPIIKAYLSRESCVCSEYWGYTSEIYSFRVYTASWCL